MHTQTNNYKNATKLVILTEKVARAIAFKTSKHLIDTH